MAEFDNLYAHGFVRVAACAPVVEPANPAANADAILKFWRELLPRCNQYSANGSGMFNISPHR